MYNTIVKPVAWVCSNHNGQQNRGRLKVHQPNSKIYLNDGDEFEIELYNPTSDNLMAEIKIDGKSISKGNIVVKRGERIYLECFPDTKKKFTFNTYKVDNNEQNKKAISDNGKVVINFYKEYTRYAPPQTVFLPNYVYYSTNQILGGTHTGGTHTTLGENSQVNFNTLNNTSIETGQVSGGSQSNQEFQSSNLLFESFISTSYSFHILPMSQRPLSKKDFITKKPKNKKVVDKIESLTKLGDLLDRGLLEHEEFIKLKSEILHK